jgi:hypothetical protein
LKKPTGSVRFRFYKQKTEKTELNRTKPKLKKKPEKKPNQTGKTEPNQKMRKPSQNRAKLEKPSQTSLNQFFP